MRNSCFFDQHHSPNSAVFILRQAKKLKPQFISNNCQTTSWNLMPILVCGGWGVGEVQHLWLLLCLTWNWKDYIVHILEQREKTGPF